MDTLNAFYAAEQRYVAAGGAKAQADYSEMEALFHPDIVGRQGPSVPFPGDWPGKDGVRKFFEVFTDTWSTLDLSDIQHFEGESGVVVTLRMRATARATGKVLDTRVAHVFTIENGLIREISVYYFDPVQVTAVTLP
jgi:ketosteroid isomerase-like protein